MDAEDIKLRAVAVALERPEWGEQGGLALCDLGRGAVACGRGTIDMEPGLESRGPQGGRQVDCARCAL